MKTINRLRFKVYSVLLPSLRFIFETWYYHSYLHRWVLILIFLFLLITGQLFTANGLILVLIGILYIVLFFIHKWLGDNA